MTGPEKINFRNEREVLKVEAFLKEGFEIEYGRFPDVTYVMREDGNIIASGSLEGNVIKYLGVDSKFRGENITEKIVTELLNEAFLKGMTHIFVFTGPHNIGIMKSMGFTEVVETRESVLLETGPYKIDDYLIDLKKRLGEPSGRRGAIVMNLNPMTKGHLSLIERSAELVDELLIFLVEEDKSIVPFEYRLKILENEMKRFPKVSVIPGGPYIISSATFPTYFIKKADSKLKAYVETDALIFGRYIAKALGITYRFLGQEPTDKVTDEYNLALKNILKNHGVEVVVFERASLNGKVISASQVRKLIREGKMDEAAALMTDSTYEFFKTEEGLKVMDKIMKDGRGK